MNAALNIVLNAHQGKCTVLIINSGHVVEVHITWCRHQLSVEPLLHHGSLQPLLLRQERVFLLGRRGHIAMHPSMSKGSQMVKEILQLVHFGGGENALEGDCFRTAALGAVRGEVN